jgi:hypothetical protein
MRRITASYKVVCDGYDEVGWIHGHITERGGKRVMRVDNVDVDSSYQRAGNATALYEALAAEACRKRVPLYSEERTKGAHSHDFWAKQHAKGRAKIVGENADGPIYKLICARTSSLASIPKTKKRTACETNTALSKAVLTAYTKGYRVDAKGKVISPSGSVRATQAKSKGPYRFETFSLRVQGRILALPVHRLAAFQKFGCVALKEKVVIRHKNDNALDNRPANLVPGSQSQNMMDRPKAQRIAVARMGGLARAKKARR